MTGGIAVILGNTGRNFAAGMSGGIAYVYDVNGSFSSLCNPEMIDLDPLSHTDGEQLHHLITNHLKYTGSTVAQFVLSDFDSQLKNFIKVFPKDYKRVLSEKKAKAEVNS